ncbi:MAG: hypothetical protein HZA50_08810 [Planctomycetes bacterium]|nr:hypothetical protein [Planctomycetota bacterium]
MPEIFHNQPGESNADLPFQEQIIPLTPISSCGLFRKGYNLHCSAGG